MKTSLNALKKTSQALDYLKLLEKKYHDRSGFDYHFSINKKAFEFLITSPTQQAWQIKVTDHKKLLAHIILISDEHLKKNEAFFGFFECVLNKKIFRILWNAITDLSLRLGFRKLYGPVNASIWHNYRIIKKKRYQEYFHNDPLSELYYYDLFKEIVRTEEIIYKTSQYNCTLEILDELAPAYYLINSRDFRINMILDQDISDKLYILAHETHSRDFCYTILPKEEFNSIVWPNLNTGKKRQLYTISKSDEILGYCLYYKTEKHLIVEDLNILPAMQGIGLTHALTYKLISDACAIGIEKIIYGPFSATSGYFPNAKELTGNVNEYVCFGIEI